MSDESRTAAFTRWFAEPGPDDPETAFDSGWDTALTQGRREAMELACSVVTDFYVLTNMGFAEKYRAGHNQLDREAICAAIRYACEKRRLEMKENHAEPTQDKG